MQAIKASIASQERNFVLVLVAASTSLMSPDLVRKLIRKVSTPSHHISFKSVQVKLCKGPKTSVMTSEGLMEMFEGVSADMCRGKFSIMSMGGQPEGLACADPGTRNPIGVSGNFHNLDPRIPQH
jgi:hypothetical protein